MKGTEEGLEGLSFRFSHIWAFIANTTQLTIIQKVGLLLHIQLLNLFHRCSLNRITMAPSALHCPVAAACGCQASGSPTLTCTTPSGHLPAGLPVVFPAHPLHLHMQSPSVLLSSPLRRLPKTYTK